ncbi:MAG: signal peptidase I [Acutalibacteraceae bacterium]|jgi:signal peptidase I
MDSITQTETKTQAAKVRRIYDLYDWMGTAVLALVVIVALFALAFRIVGVDGTSMLQTLQDGDRLVLRTSIAYTPERGDIVVINRYTVEPLVKRVIGVEGDTVEITADGKVLVNGQEQNESYIWLENPYNGTPQRDFQTPQTVPAGCVFVMGDNRQNSHDSRAADIGFVKCEDIAGKAVWRIWPFDQFGGLEKE